MGVGAVPEFVTVALTVTGVVSFTEAGEAVTPEMVRSGLEPSTPLIWSSATWPPGAPVFAVNDSRRSATAGAVLGTLIVTVLLLPVGGAAGLNVYCAEP